MSLQKEIHQTRPFRSLGHEATLALFRTTDLVRRYMAELLEPRGVTVQQYNVLRILRGAGEEGLPTLEIGERMVEQTPGVTRLVTRLVNKGWVRRERSMEDRRSILCHLTDEGRKLLADLDEPIHRADSHVVASLGDDEVRSLLARLEEIRSHLAGTTGTP